MLLIGLRESPVLMMMNALFKKFPIIVLRRMLACVTVVLCLLFLLIESISNGACFILDKMDEFLLKTLKDKKK